MMDRLHHQSVLTYSILLPKPIRVLASSIFNFFLPQMAGNYDTIDNVILQVVEDNDTEEALISEAGEEEMNDIEEGECCAINFDAYV